MRRAGLVLALAGGAWILVSCRLGPPGTVVDPNVVGVITENESVAGDDDQLVTVNGRQLRILDPGRRELQGPGLGVDRLLIYWETEAGPSFITTVESVPGCYPLDSDAAFLVDSAIVFVWADLPNLGIRFPIAPGLEPDVDAETGELFPGGPGSSIGVCLDEHGIVIPTP